MQASERVLSAIAVTCEVMGVEVSPIAARAWAHDLARYDADQVVRALERCRKEVRGRLTIADVIDRLEDGRPGPEEAWAEAPRDEESSVVWCEEQRAAWAAARHLIDEGEVVQARMTFLEVYRKLCREARERGEPPAWTASLGTDEHGREQALLRAVQIGRMQVQHALWILPGSPALLELGGRPAALEDGTQRDMRALLPPSLRLKDNP